jgi:hypothetical protein
VIGVRALIAAAFAAALGLTIAFVGAQTPAERSGAIPRTADGKPNLAGVWQTMNTAAWDIQDHTAAPGIPAGQGVVEGNELPYRPEMAAKKQENFKNRETADPETKCYMPGVPRATYMPFPFQIVQAPKQVTMLYEYAHTVRNIFMDTPHPRGPLYWWMGDSRGRWEGDTLVVDVTDFNDETWFDRTGNFHSTALHVIERYTLVDADHINYEATIEDAQVFTRPWKMSMILYRHREKNFRLLEYECFSW